MATSNAKPPLDREAQYRQVLHYASLCGLIVCPLIMALPPRKFDLYTVALISGTVLGGNQLMIEYTGRSIPESLHSMALRKSKTELPSDRAREVKALLQQERDRQRATGIQIEHGKEGETTRALREKMELEKKERGVLEKLWMGEEGSDWKKKRDERERVALQEGKGYADLIMEQIWEVWNWGRDTMEDVKKEDEKVVESRKTEEEQKRRN